MSDQVYDLKDLRRESVVLSDLSREIGHGSTLWHTKTQLGLRPLAPSVTLVMHVSHITRLGLTHSLKFQPYFDLTLEQFCFVSDPYIHGVPSHPTYSYAITASSSLALAGTHRLLTQTTSSTKKSSKFIPATSTLTS